MKLINLIPKAFCCLTEAIMGPTVYTIQASKNVEWTNKVKYINGSSLFYNICKPKMAGNEKLPLFIYIHGGGWVSGSPNYRKAIISKIAERGYVVLAIYYGLAPKYKFAPSIINMYKAIEHFKNSAQKSNVDFDSIFIGGESAGAHLSCVISTISTNDKYKEKFENLPCISNDLRIKGTFLICGIYNLDTTEMLGYPAMYSYIVAETGIEPGIRKKSEEGNIFSPLKYITSNFPPSVIVTAMGDKLQTEGFILVKKLKSLSVKCILRHGVGATAIHAFPVAQFLPETKRIMDDAFNFLNGLNLKQLN
ncbi:MAG: alpha/beta hydrolase [Christensenellaceae bacterium]|jgi:acetyl esterase/lipase|nr:alpha/beta hydrolase [Christensenellaceae bacterium]